MVKKVRVTPRRGSRDKKTRICDSCCGYMSDKRTRGVSILSDCCALLKNFGTVYGKNFRRRGKKLMASLMNGDIVDPEMLLFEDWQCLALSAGDGKVAIVRIPSEERLMEKLPMRDTN